MMMNGREGLSASDEAGETVGFVAVSLVQFVLFALVPFCGRISPWWNPSVTGDGALGPGSRWRISDLALVVFGLVLIGHGK